MSARILALGVAFALGASGALRPRDARAWEAGGRILSATHGALRAPAPGSDRLMQNVQLGWFRIRESIDDGPRFEATIRARLEPRSLDPDRALAEAELHEFFMSWRAGDFDLSFGKRVRTWGIADVVNPTRFFGAKDNSLLLSNETDKELGIPQLSIGWNPGGGAWTYTGVLLPSFVPERVQIPSTALGGAAIVDTAREREEGWGGGGGLRVAYLGDSFDFALLGFLGLDPRPEYEFRAFGTSLGLATLYRKTAGVGLEASSSAGSWIFRFEGSYRYAFSESDRDPFVLSRAEGVLGVERPLGAGWRVMVQGLGHWTQSSFSSDSLVSSSENSSLIAVARLNESLYRTSREFGVGGTVRIGYDSEESAWTAEAFALSYLFDRDLLSRAALGWKPWTGGKLLVGVDAYIGPDSSLFGSLRGLTSAWVELSAEF